MRLSLRRIATGFGAIALSLPLLAVPSTTAGATTHTNWVVARVVVAEATENLSGRITFDGTYDGTEPVVAGFATHLDTATWDYTSSYAVDSRTGPVDITTTEGLGRQSVRIAPGSSGSFTNGSYGFTFGGFDFAPGDEVDLLFYLTGTALSGIEASAEGDTGAVPIGLTTGAGAANVALASTTTAGTGAAAGSLAAGTTSNTVTSDRGIAGTRVARCAAGACTYGVTGPAGSTQAIEASTGVASYTSGRPSFAGPAGDWTFRWTGAGNSSVMVAYAPIGDLWPIFAG